MTKAHTSKIDRSRRTPSAEEVYASIDREMLAQKIYQLLRKELRIQRERLGYQRR
ncbi:MAG TPA: hypothetical protein G4N98_09745 [Thermoflexia bacterium]|nr:hypothetical protein [Thermoflexia bacterium]